MRADPSGRPAPADQTRLTRRRRVLHLTAAVLLAVALAALYVWAVRTEDGQLADIRLLVDLQALNPALGPAAIALRPGVLLAGALVCAVLGALALARRRWRSLCAAVVVVVVSVGGNWVLKEVLLDRPYLGEHGYTVNTFPSGHVSATLALLVAAALLFPAGQSPTTRRLALLTLAALGAVACFVSLLEHVHRPSDVVGSVLLVGAVATLTVAALRPPLPLAS